MHIEKTDENEFFQGLNQRIADLAAELEQTAQKIRNNPNSSTYHLDSFFRPLKIMRKLQKLRDKARAFKENENEDVVYLKKEAEGEQPKYFYIPRSKYDQSKLAEIVRKMEEKEETDVNLGYIG